MGPIFVSLWPSPWKAKTSESSKSPTTTPFKPQPLFLHAISARTMLILYYIHRSHVLVWPLSPVSFLSGGRSNEGEIWCRHQTRDFGNSFLYELSRNATTPHTQMRLVYIWVKRRRLSATEVVHGPHKSIRTNFRMGGVMGVVMALGHISRYRHAPTHRYRPKIPSSNIQEGI